MKTHKLILWIKMALICILFINSFQGIQVSANKDMTQIKIGEYVSFGQYNGEPIIWKVIHLTKEGNPLLFSEKILTLKAFDAKGDLAENRGDENRKSNGSNYWNTSNLREWLNSDKQKVEYTHQKPNKQNVWEGQNAYDEEEGFLYSFGIQEREMIQPTVRKVILPETDKSEMSGGFSIHYFTSNIKNILQTYDTSIYKNINDKVFLLSIKELKNYVYDRGWDYNTQPTQKAVEKSEFQLEQFSVNKPWPYWLDTPRADTSDGVISPFLHGNIHSFYAFSGNVGVRPALYLKKELIIKNTGTQKDPYIVALKEQKEDTSNNNNNGNNNSDGGSSVPPNNNSDITKTVIDKLQEQNDLMKKLAEQNKSPQQKTEEMILLLNQINKDASSIDNEKQSIEALEKITETLKYSSLMETGVLNKSIIDKFAELHLTAQNLLQNMQDSTKSIELVEKIMKETKWVFSEENKSFYETQDLQNSLITLGKEAVNKVGQIVVEESNINVNGNSVHAVMNEEKIKQQVEMVSHSANHMTNLISDIIGGKLEEPIKPEITINIPKQEKYILEMQSDFSKGLIEVLQNSNISNVNLKLDHMTFHFSPDAFGGIKEDILSLSSKVIPSLPVKIPQDVEKVIAMPIMEFFAKDGDKEIEKFEQLVQVSFDLSDINLDGYTTEDLQSLTVYMLEENTGAWKAVGGKYDPITKTISLPRLHFSIYTVMKSNKEFQDLDKHWAEEEITIMLRKGVLDQVEDFSPMKEVTREEFIAWLVRSYGLDKSTKKPPFVDVSKDNPYYNEIAVAYENGLVKGKSNILFDPKGKITRQEIAVMLVRTMKKYDHLKAFIVPGKEVFKDEKQIATWAKDSVILAQKNNLIKGYPDNTFKPNNYTKKDEAAVLIYRIFYMKK